MIRTSIVRSIGATVGAAALVLVSAVSASAGSMSMHMASLNAKDAALVPAALKNVTWQVATDATYAPDESMKGNTMVGFDVDLMKAVATTLGVKIVENNVTFDNIIVGVQSKKYQVGNSSFTDTKAREKQVNFVDYFKAGEGVYAKVTSTAAFTSVQSFCGTSVAVETGTVEQTDAGAIKCTNGKKVTVDSYPTQTEANTAVASGHDAFGFADSQIAGYIASQSKGLFKYVGKPVAVAPYGIAVAKTADGLALAKAIQAAMKTLVANGTYNSILSSYGVTSGALTASQMVLNGATS
jgi:polar amino acid transport system substrate-binding protein